MVGHRRIHFAGELDEARGEIVFASLPGQIVRIDRDAVAAEAGAGIKGHEAERLCGGAIDNFENVKVHAQAKLLEFIHERDIHAAENIFEQLHHFGGARGADGNHFRDDLRVESRGGASAGRIHATHYFGNLREAELFVARIFTLRREGEIEIGRDVFAAVAVGDRAAQAALFENRGAPTLRSCRDTWCFRER